MSVPSERPRPAALDVRALSAGYGGNQILHDITMTVAPNEVVTIIGPNGAGKSTLLKTIMGYLIPHQGSVHFDGGDITTLEPNERVRTGIAYVPQLDNVFPSLTVEENLRMGGFTLSKATARERMHNQYEQFPRLAERRRQRVTTMSGGERQMLAMARALMTDPQLLLLDEPSAALSPKLADQVFEQVRRIHEQGRTVLIVEQNAENALRISHRCVVLVEGQTAFEAEAHQVLSDPKIREAYLGGGG